MSTSLKTSIGAIMLATASTYSAASKSGTATAASSSWLETCCTAAAAVVGAIAVVKLLKRQHDERITRESSSPSKSKGGGGSCDDASDTISVEGSVMVTLPTWAIASSEDYFSHKYTSDLEMMSLAIHLSDRNITEGTGGPFGAAIFERHPEKGYCSLVSIGVNRVVPLGNSTLHGETVAIQLAQRRLGSYTLMLDVDGGDGSEDGLFWDEGHEDHESHQNQPGSACSDSTPTVDNRNKAASLKPAKRKRQFELFTSCEPCAMCLGATLWSGVSRMVCGACKDDAQAIGFDEGPVFDASYKYLEDAGIQVTRSILREEAAKVLQRYGASGQIYNRS